MVKKLQKYVERIRKIATSCKKSLKRELRVWRSFSFSLAIKLLLHLLSKSHGASVRNNSSHSIPPSASLLNFLRVARQCLLSSHTLVSDCVCTVAGGADGGGWLGCAGPVAAELGAAADGVPRHRALLPPRLAPQQTRHPLPRPPGRRLCPHLGIHLQVGHGSNVVYSAWN